MNTTIDSFQSAQPGQQAANNNAKPLWAAVGILGVAVLAMGGTMIYQGSKTAAPPALAAALVPAQTVQTSLAKPATAPAYVADDMVETPKAAIAKPAPAPAPAQKVVKPTPRPAPAPRAVATAPNVAPNTTRYSYPSSFPSPAPVVAQICSTCGAVESVTPVRRSTKADGPGVGAVAGGVAGAVLGSQVGRGNGRTAAAILGAIGGGLAGNAIEKNMKTQTVYEVGVRMEDGSRRSIEMAQPPAVGSKVTVDGGNIRSNDRGVERGADANVYRAPAPTMQRTSQSDVVYERFNN